MSIVDALVLGVIQGLTEFLPISSSGHLALANLLLDLRDNLPYTLLLHLASLSAVFVHFRSRLLGLLSKDRRELVCLAVASIPIFIVGATLGNYIEQTQAMPLLIGICFIVNGIFLVIADRGSSGTQRIAEAPAWKIVAIGIAQAIRLPGLSRSGGTIGTGWLCGIDRSEAVRFSFLLSIPAILGASAKKALDLDLHQVNLPVVPILIGMGATFVLSLISIRIVEKLSTRNRFLGFAIYGAAAGIATVAWVVSKG